MIARELAAWVLGLAEVPGPVSAAATRHLLDGFGTALGALRTGAAAPAIEVARGLGGPPEAAVLGGGDLLSAPAAARPAADAEEFARTVETLGDQPDAACVVRAAARLAQLTSSAQEKE